MRLVALLSVAPATASSEKLPPIIRLSPHDQHDANREDPRFG
jgi:hypothetical protein